MTQPKSLENQKTSARRTAWPPLVCNILGTAFAAAVIFAAFSLLGPESSVDHSKELKTAEAVVQKLSSGKFSVDSTFAGPSDNLVGVNIAPVGDKSAPKAVVWLVDGKFILAGQLFDESGKNLTDQASSNSNKKFSNANIAAKALAATGLIEGSKGPLVISFEDPNCMFCHKFTMDIDSALSTGKLQVKVVPVGFLRGEDSIKRAAAVLQAPVPTKAWAENMKNFDSTHELGGIAPATPTKLVLKAIQDNTELLQSTGKVATPTLLLCKKGDKVPELFHGIPSDLGDLLKNPEGALTSIQADGSCAPS